MRATADLDEPIRTELLVIFDQFEQYFVYHGDEDGPETFAVQFPQAVNRDDLRASFLISLREDAYTQLDRFEGRILNLFAGNLRIEHLDEKAATAAIVKPVETYNELLGNGDPPYEVEPGLVKAVIRRGAGRKHRPRPGRRRRRRARRAGADAGRDSVPPARHVAALGRGGAAARTSSGWRRSSGLGGAEQIVRRHLDEAMSALGDDERDVAARMLHQLVTPSGARIVHKADDLAGYAGVTLEVAEPILEQLDERRILRTIDPAPGDKTPRFEIRHDVLAGAVVEWGRQYEERRRAAEEETRQREELEKQRRRLRMRMLVGFALVLAFLIPAVIGGVYVWNARSDARAQRDTARSLVGCRRGTAARRAIPDDASTRDSGLLDSLTPRRRRKRSSLRPRRFHRRAIFAGHMGNVAVALFSPDGIAVATAGADGTARLWDPVAGALLATLAARDRGKPVGVLNDIAFGPDGRLLATAAATAAPGCGTFRPGICATCFAATPSR